ncbi:Stabilin-1 [Bagarius yarrelli]|uniref:Stabilin-1 n=1 Tax=Bagarius yarrelli TaxID=175774 RepID=A0A556U3T2_BAGYA|nr:Stabilin-1 [Bagarius yarrelli]
MAEEIRPFPCQEETVYLFFSLSKWCMVKEPPLLTGNSSFSKSKKNAQHSATSNRCDEPRTVRYFTVCTSCAAAPAISCPKGYIKTSTDAECRYNVQIGDRLLELPGCSRSCEKVTLIKRCCPGFFGSLCSPCPSLSGKVCNWHGTCMDGESGNGTCVCEKGYTGFLCNKCPNGTYGERCSSVCDCVHGECNPDPDGDGQCYCQPPYSGPKCDKGVCTKDVCDINADCSYKGAGQFQCTCKTGFEGDGKFCTPINSCAKNNGGCPTDSTICEITGSGQSICVCKSGMEGEDPRAGCRLKSACKENTCHRSARCETGQDGTARCVCGSEQISDGWRCYSDIMERVLELDREGSQAGNLTGSIALFEKGCKLSLSKHGPFTAFIPVDTSQISSGKLNQARTAEAICKHHLILGQHLYKDLEGHDLWTYGGELMRFKPNKKFISKNDPDTVFTIINSDIPASNGIIHIVDKVFTFATVDTYDSAEFSSKTIGDILAEDARFNRFVSLVDNCGAPMPLQGPGPLTLFVPTNKAIDRSRDGSIIYMLKEAKHKLQELLRHHMFSQAAVTMDQVASMTEIHTMANQAITVSISDDGRVLLTEKKISFDMKDIIASNGIIHIVDGLLLPPSIIPIMPHRCDVNETTIITCSDGIYGDGSCKCKPDFMGIGCHICSNPMKHGENCDEDCRCVHGVCDNRPGSQGVCRRNSCLSGYTGELCDLTAMLCDSDGASEHCHIHAYCTRVNNINMCVCNPGYEGDGYSCTEANLCLRADRGGCHIGAQCLYAGPGNISCICNEGWTGDGFVCVEINNCLTANRGGCHEQAECIYIGPGQSECACKKGFMGDGIMCQIVNPCLTDNGGCHATATCSFNNSGIHQCTCPEDHAGDGFKCYGNILMVLKPPISDIPPPPPDLMEVLQNTPSFSLFREAALLYNLTESISKRDFTIFIPSDSAVKEYLLKTNSTQLDENIVKYHVITKEQLFPEHLTDGTLKTTLLGNEYQIMIHLNSENKTLINDVELDGNMTEIRHGVIISISRVLVIHKNYCSKDIYMKTFGRCGDCNSSPKCLFGSKPIKDEFPLNMKSNCRYRMRVGKRRKSVPGCMIDCLKNVKDHSCCPGYFGRDCFKCPGTVDNWCSNNGKCQDGLFGNGECLCNEGFHGTACEMCEPGRYGKDCKSECHCDHGKCLDGIDGNGQCICYKGWKGDNNGGCSVNAICQNTGPGERNCTCRFGYKGNGIECMGTVSRIDLWESKNRIPDLLRYHIVSCEEISGSQLKSMTHVVSASGHVLNFSVRDGAVYINGDTKIITSDYECSNGVIHFINKVLIPYELKNETKGIEEMLNITNAVEAYGYTVFGKLLQKANLMATLQHTAFQPFTMFWPTDKAFNSLPQEQKNWLYSEDHLDKLQAYLKFHIIRDQRTIAIALPTEKTVRTLYGSWLTFSCSQDLTAFPTRAEVTPNSQVGSLLSSSDADVSGHIAIGQVQVAADELGWSCRMDYRLLHATTQCGGQGDILINGNDAKIVDRNLQFLTGMAHGIDKVLEPPNIGAHCDDFSSIEVKNKTNVCSRSWNSYRRHYFYDDFEFPSPYNFKPFGCNRMCSKMSWVSKCCKNHYGRNCQVCSGGLEAPCGEHGDCDDGRYGTGTCKCHTGFNGTACELCEKNHYGSNCTGVKPVCSPECHSKAVCLPENQCQCEPAYIGNGYNCTAPDLCSEYNGGCHEQADCTQSEINVICTCKSGYSGDGNVCSPINACVEETNGGCSDFANCIFIGPNERRCECQQGYVGNGLQCFEKVVPPVDRCLENNGDCHANAICKDLHFHTKTAGVFHLRSPAGKYMMNYSTAGAACKAEGATLATLNQLSDAQQLGMHLCVAGWIDGKKVGYPIRFPSVKCGDNQVGIILYKDPDVNTPYDAYCYRIREVKCECGPGYVGDGDFCNGNLASVIATHSNVSIFYSMLVKTAEAAEEGKKLLDFLSTSSTNLTLFVPHNAGFSPNETLSLRDLEYHVSSNNSLHYYEDLKHNTAIPSRLGFNLKVIIKTDNQTQVEVTPSTPSAVRSQSSAPTVTAVLLVIFIGGIIAGVAYYFLRNKNDAFSFKYFKNDDEDGNSTKTSANPAIMSIPNPLYSGYRAFVEPFGEEEQCESPASVAANTPNILD